MKKFHKEPVDIVVEAEALLLRLPQHILLISMIEKSIVIEWQDPIDKLDAVYLVVKVKGFFKNDTVGDLERFLDDIARRHVA